MSCRLAPAVLLAVLGSAAPALAQSSDQSFALGFTLGAGVATGPGYFGSDEQLVVPDFGFGFQYLRLPTGHEFGDPDFDAVAEGFGMGGSFRIIGERNAADFPELTGLEDRELAIEVGVSLGYTAPGWEAFADLRYGALGHESLVADLGADAVLRPTDALTLRAGPRLFLGDAGYNQAYFGVTAAESLASGLTAFAPEAGLVSTGVELSADYRIDDLWGLYGAVRYDMYGGAVEDSPILLQDDSLSAGIGVTRRFSFGF